MLVRGLGTPEDRAVARPSDRLASRRRWHRRPSDRRAEARQAHQPFGVVRCAVGRFHEFARQERVDRVEPGRLGMPPRDRLHRREPQRRETRRGCLDADLGKEDRLAPEALDRLDPRGEGPRAALDPVGAGEQRVADVVASAADVDRDHLEARPIEMPHPAIEHEMRHHMIEPEPRQHADAEAAVGTRRCRGLDGIPIADRGTGGAGMDRPHASRRHRIRLEPGGPKERPRQSALAEEFEPLDRGGRVGFA